MQVDSCRSWVTFSLECAQAGLSDVEAACAQKTAELEAFRWAQAQAAVQAYQTQQLQQQQQSPLPASVDGESSDKSTTIAMGWPVDQVV